MSDVSNRTLFHMTVQGSNLCFTFDPPDVNYLRGDAPGVWDQVTLKV